MDFDFGREGSQIPFLRFSQKFSRFLPKIFSRFPHHSLSFPFLTGTRRYIDVENDVKTLKRPCNNVVLTSSCVGWVDTPLMFVCFYLDDATYLFQFDNDFQNSIIGSEVFLKQHHGQFINGVFQTKGDFSYRNGPTLERLNTVPCFGYVLD